MTQDTATATGSVKPFSVFSLNDNALQMDLDIDQLQLATCFWPFTKKQLISTQKKIGSCLLALIKRKYWEMFKVGSHMHRRRWICTDKLGL
jgi:hypothetical protein